MKKLNQLALLLSLFFVNFNLFGQNITSETKAFFECSQSHVHNSKMATDEQYHQRHLAIEQQLHKLLKKGSQSRNPAPFTLPVVVHIIHDNGTENISDTQVETAIQHMNNAFANTGYYNPATGVNTQISFCLAKRDPDGNATSGIIRVQSPLTALNSNLDDQTVKNLSRFDPLEYINIWVVREICNNNGCGVAGYAYLPASHGSSFDGIVLESEYMGSIPAYSSVLVHEMGHYLGLYHTFEGGCSNNDCQLNGDRVCDTPPDNTTARPSCPDDLNSCTTDEDDTSNNNPFRPIAQGGLGDQIDMKENYMDYSRLECYDRFSQGQADRMHNVIDNIRYSLLASPACVDPCPIPFEIGFMASATDVPIGTTVNFTNTTIGADNYEWSITGSVFSTVQNSSYTFTQEGTYAITLSVFSNLNDCFPIDSTITIEVFCPIEADFTASASSVLAGSSVSFTNNSTGSIDTYNWLVNGTSVSNSIDLNFSTPQPGSYNVCLEASNADCNDVHCFFVEAFAPTSDCGGFLFTYGSPEFEEGANCITPASDGGFYVGGNRGTASLIMKFDNNGIPIWQKSFELSDISSTSEGVYYLLEDGDYLIGTSRYNNNNDQYCFKYDMVNDDFVWIRAITEGQTSRTYEIINIDNSPNYILIGYLFTPSPQSCNATYGTLDKATGNLLSVKEYDFGACEIGFAAVVVNDKIYTTGLYTDPGGFGFDVARPGISQLELDGTENWSRLYLVPSPEVWGYLFSNTILEDQGSLVVAGGGDLIVNSTFEHYANIFKTDLDGNILWASIFDLPVSPHTCRFSQIVDQGDGYLAVGYYTINGQEDLIFVKIDPSGNLMWSKTLPSNDNEITSLKGAFAKGGYAYITTSRVSNTGSDILLLKISPDGVIEGDCEQLTDIQAEFWQLQDPFDGFEDITETNVTHQNSAGQSFTEDVNLPVDTICFEPCVELCNNGLDDDCDGLADCDDPDCPCFEDCGNTFVKALGLPQQNESLSTVLLHSSGHLYCGGNIQNDGLLVKMTTEGDVLLQQQFNLTSQPDRILSLIEDDEGFIIGVGFGQNVTSGRTGFIFKYNTNTESIIWSNTFSTLTGFWTVSINPTNGHYIAAGATAQTNQDAVVAEFNRFTGTLNWTRFIDIGSSDAFYGIVPVGNFLYMPTRYTLYGNTDKMRAGITALNNIGVEQWSKTYLYPASASARQYAFAMEQDNGGLVAAICGNPSGIPINGFKTGLMRTDYFGNLEWATEYDLAGYTGEPAGYGMTTTPDGFLLYGYAIAGDEDLMIIKTDKAGNALWARAYGGVLDDDFLFNADNQLVQSGDYIYIVGRTRFFNNSEDAFIIKVNASDGSVSDDDCIYTASVDVSTSFYQDPFEGNEPTSSNPYTNVINQVNVPSPIIPALNYETLCQGSAFDLVAVIDSAYCNVDSLGISIQICNAGSDALIPGVPYTLYDGDPRLSNSATSIGAYTVPDSILTGECFSTNLNIPYPNNTIFLVANDNGSLPTPFNPETDFPITNITECEYSNNLDSLIFEPPIFTLDLGPDTTVCENGIFYLDAGPGFVSYLWQDGSFEQTLTAFEEGTYWVRVTTPCGDVLSDTLNIILVEEIAITLGPDTTICQGGSITLSTLDDPNYTYQWSPSSSLNCDNCPTVIATPTDPTTYEVVVSNNIGCVSIDSVRIDLEPCISGLDTAICLGDTLFIEGQALLPNTSDTITLIDGSMLYVTVNALDTFFITIDTATCAGQSIDYFGNTIQAGESQTFNFLTVNGCDSTIIVNVAIQDTFLTVMDTVTCAGQNFDFFGSMIPAGQSQTFNLSTIDGCDSTIIVNVAALDTFYTVIDTALCEGQSFDFFGTAIPAGQSQTFNLSTVDGCDSTIIVNITALDTFYTVIDTAVCEGQSFDFFGTVISAGQSQTFNLSTVDGCDSTIIVNVAALDTFFTVIDTAVCKGQSFDFFGTVISVGQSQTFNLSTIDGCDSTIIVNVAALDTFYTVIDTALCEGQSFDFFGTAISAGQSQTFNLSTVDGCDSTIIVNVAQLDTQLVILDFETCFNTPYEFDGQNIPPNSTMTFNYLNIAGCDSTVIVNVTELPDNQTYETLQACEGESVEIFGEQIFETGLYSSTFSAYNGCDSTHNVYFVVLDTVELNIPDGGLSCTYFSGELTVETTGGIPPYQILWSDGQTTKTATDLVVGEYYVTVTDAAGCMSIGVGYVYEIIPLPLIEVETQHVTCNGDEDGAIVIKNPNGGTAPYSYSLDGIEYQTESLFTNLSAGNYTIFIKDDDMCENEVEIVIEEPDPIIIQLPADTTIKYGSSITINPMLLSGKPISYEWAPPRWIDCPDCPTVIASPEETTLYILSVRDSAGCESSDDIHLFVDKKIDVYIPNAFSPNGDGTNDIFMVFAGPEVEQVNTLQIFNRWGGQVFRKDNFIPNHPDSGWDGTFNGELLNPGVFAYFAEIKLSDDRTILFKGYIQLVR